MTVMNLSINNNIVGPIEVDPEIMMIEFLHEYLNLTGTKFGCGGGICHACVILVEDEQGMLKTERTCIHNALVFNGKKVHTIEGHATKDKYGEIIALHPVQESFSKHFSFQCGWCTSGFMNETIALIQRLKKDPIKKTDVETTIEAALGEHICRCTGYVKYYQSAKDLILSIKGLTK
ncbi:hypothetical protein GCM10007916_29880 [Psychromonas marina]|uniref:(2Fe-2S)-binding protein n=1 Tax=Psychromonas marina TaxID=88364 RepID=A0ABQ6E409_9GAMM|nr:2Fe-2S iron-sulfur cluster-binding protein [Psychromonas marina]GLS91918.1 hypothetical protein GCM10007916_29880 [Psychromonas marina]